MRVLCQFAKSFENFMWPSREMATLEPQEIQNENDTHLSDIQMLTHKR